MIKAVIFDLDGTLIETENLWREINTELAHSFNTTITEDIRKKMMGRNNHSSLTIFRDMLGIKTPVNELIKIRNRLLLSRTSKIRLRNGAMELFNLLDDMNIKKAIATSSFEEFVKKVLSELKITHRFNEVVTSDQVKLSKPDPAIYLETAKKLGVLPENCLVVEDAENGVNAGYNARMKVIAVPHEHSNTHNFSNALRILDNLEKIDKNLILNY